MCLPHSTTNHWKWKIFYIFISCTLCIMFSDDLQVKLEKIDLICVQSHNTSHKPSSVFVIPEGKPLTMFLSSSLFFQVCKVSLTDGENIIINVSSTWLTSLIFRSVAGVRYFVGHLTACLPGMGFLVAIFFILVFKMMFLCSFFFSTATALCNLKCLFCFVVLIDISNCCVWLLKNVKLVLVVSLLFMQ